MRDQDLLHQPRLVIAGGSKGSVLDPAAKDDRSVGRRKRIGDDPEIGSALQERRPVEPNGDAENERHKESDKAAPSHGEGTTANLVAPMGRRPRPDAGAFPRYD